MRFVIQRVLSAQVVVDNKVVGSIGPGLVVLAALAPTDTMAEAQWAMEKTMRLRIFDGADGFLSRSIEDVEGEILLVSQFTLYGDLRKGSRPSFSHAMAPNTAKVLFSQIEERWKARWAGRVQSGIFGADMRVSLCNDGPVTLILDKDCP